MVKKYDLFETDRLYLKATDLADSKLLLELLNTPKWIRFIGDRDVHDIRAAKKYIQDRMLPQYERLGYGNYCMIRKHDETSLGFCGLYDRDGLDSVDVGFAILPAFEGQGYTFEAASFLLDFGFNTLNLSMIQGITAKDNIASQRLLEKLGLESKGTIFLPDDTEETILYQKTI
jgi:ribosomal-protein-alanine N-acetyltransferase